VLKPLSPALNISISTASRPETLWLKTKMHQLFIIAAMKESAKCCVATGFSIHLFLVIR
jgi:hypothetical protein